MILLRPPSHKASHSAQQARLRNTSRFDTESQKILNFLQFPDVYNNPFPEEEAIDQVLKIRQPKKELYLNILDQLHIPPILIDNTGESSPVYEAFIHRVLVMHKEGSDFIGTFYDSTVGKTQGDIEVKASITKENGRLHIQISYRPVVLEGMEFKPLDHLDLDTTGHPPTDEKDIHKKASRILPILDALKATQ